MYNHLLNQEKFDLSTLEFSMEDLYLYALHIYINIALMDPNDPDYEMFANVHQYFDLQGKLDPSVEYLIKSNLLLAMGNRDKIKLGDKNMDIFLDLIYDDCLLDTKLTFNQFL